MLSPCLRTLDLNVCGVGRGRFDFPGITLKMHISLSFSVMQSSICGVEQRTKVLGCAQQGRDCVCKSEP